MAHSKHEPDILLLEIPMGAAALRFCLGTFKGRERIDARIWFYPAGSDELHASRKGITIPAEHLPAAIDAMQRGLRIIRGDAGADSGKTRKGRPPAITDEELRDMLDGGWTITEIAAEVGVSKSTISRRAKALHSVAPDVARNSNAQHHETSIGAALKTAAVST